MHLISAERFITLASKHPNTVEIAKSFAKKVKDSSWQNLIEVQANYLSAEAVGNFTVFNIKGNKYRLILSIDYEIQVAYFKYFLTHSEYDEEKWKDDPHY